VLLAALLRAWQRWCGQRTLLLDLEGHGRAPLFDDIDLSRTVGWFTAICPLRLELPPDDGAQAVLQAVTRCTAALPDRGIGYGLLRYLNPEAGAVLRGLPAPAVSFNYLGQFDAVDARQAPVRTAPEPTGAPRDPSFPRRHLLEINGSLSDGMLAIDIHYSARLHDAEPMAALAAGFVRRCWSLPAAGSRRRAKGRRPTDSRRRACRATTWPPCWRRSANPRGVRMAAPDVDDILELTPLQHGMLFHSLAEPDARLYFEQVCVFLPMPLEPEPFRQAWQAVVDRHQALRAGFHWAKLDKPVQVIHRQAPLHVHLEDWSRLPNAEQMQRLQTYLQADRAQGLVLQQAPLLHVALFRLGRRRTSSWPASTTPSSTAGA